MSFIKSFAVATALGAAPAAAITAAPGDAPKKAEPMPIVEVVTQLEKEGYGPFTELSIDDGAWEAEAYKDDVPYELRVDLHTGEVLSEHRDDSEARPPQHAKPLSEILQLLSKEGFESIDDASFERRYWELEVHREDGEHEIHVDPASGKVVSDRIDD
jgi:uncharacterized membrane protein YkoI